MRVEVYKSDIKDFLWLQNALEDVLRTETLKRAIANDHYEKTQEWLYKDEFFYFNGVVEVAYESLKGSKYKKYSEVYTLNQIFQLALTPGDV